jgi:hypothetical protein
MRIVRRNFLQSSIAAASATMLRAQSRTASQKFGMPGPFPGRVIAVEHPGCIAGGLYQREPVEAMMHRGMQELTGAAAWQDAWRALFGKG